jgi:MYXO-CTERM domain-containing protein
VASGLGYRRDNQGNTYDNAEWAFIDLRLAAADFGMGWSQAGEILLDRVGTSAQQAYGLIPELYDPASGEYAGAVPMVGFGAAAYLLALEARAQGPVAPVDWKTLDGGSLQMPDAGTSSAAAVGAGDGGAAPARAAAGCACTPGEGTDGGWLLPTVGLIVYAAHGRRRRGRIHVDR